MADTNPSVRFDSPPRGLFSGQVVGSRVTCTVLVFLHFDVSHHHGQSNEFFVYRTIVAKSSMLSLLCIHSLYTSRYMYINKCGQSLAVFCRALFPPGLSFFC